MWQVLQALRAHDDRFNAMVNKLELNSKKDEQIQVIGIGGAGDFGDSPAKPASDPKAAVQGVLNLIDISEWKEAIYAKIVQKVGDRRYWEDWAKDVAVIANRHVTRIRSLLDDPRLDITKVFGEFVAGLRLNLNDSITEDDAIEMLSQHLITKPVFDALFSDYSFAANNPVSIVMQNMVDALDEHNLANETETLDRFYESVRLRADGIDNAEGRQRIIIELYEKFFKAAFPKTTDSLGVVYTPIEIVDFILHSVEVVLSEEFGASISDQGVHVLDPFTGTGTFMVRLIQSGIVEPEDIARKYATELHANEIVLLAYYIAAINIEAAFHDTYDGGYHPFEGIVLTDTFQMFEGGQSMDDVYFPQNNARVTHQKEVDIRVIVGNPPYSVGQGSENDDNRNLDYPTLDQRIRETYAAKSDAGLKRNLYDSYVRAFRWASDRLGTRGIVCFVSNGSFIDNGSADGFRKSLVDEFSSIYCLNLRGNQRTSGDTSRREGGKVFGSGSRTPVAITLLVKNPDRTGPCQLHYRDIGDYLSRESKLALVEDAESVSGIPWDTITPDDSGDWINLRDPLFESFAPLGSKKDLAADPVFSIYSQGVLTARDAWAYNFSRSGLLASMGACVKFYNQQRVEFASLADSHGDRSDSAVEAFIETDKTKISWTFNLKGDLRKDKSSSLSPEHAVESMYRPFCKQWLYFDRQWNERVYQLPKLFPTPSHKNLIISLNASDARKPFGALMVNVIPNYALSDPGQCFPMYHYVPSQGDGTLFSSEVVVDGLRRHEAVSDRTLDHYRSRYGAALSKEDIFFYVYGLLHSPEYCQRFASDLSKMIPRIPMAVDFDAFSTAGRQLAEWHLNYETVEPWPLEGLPEASADLEDLRVTKMAFGKINKVIDKSTIIVNPFVTLRGVPEVAYDYELNGKSAIAWIMDRYQVKADKDSGIINDPNQWSDDPRYVVDLVARIVRVSVESAAIVKGLPPLGI